MKLKSDGGLTKDFSPVKSRGQQQFEFVQGNVRIRSRVSRERYINRLYAECDVIARKREINSSKISVVGTCLYSVLEQLSWLLTLYLHEGVIVQPS